MMKPTVKLLHSITLNFELPGRRSASASRGVNPHARDDIPMQLERDWKSEQHSIEIDAANAVETRDTLRELATQIDVLLSQGLLK